MMNFFIPGSARSTLMLVFLMPIAGFPAWGYTGSKVFVTLFLVGMWGGISWISHRNRNYDTTKK